MRLGEGDLSWEPPADKPRDEDFSDFDNMSREDRLWFWREMYQLGPEVYGPLCDWRVNREPPVLTELPLPHLPTGKA